MKSGGEGIRACRLIIYFSLFDRDRLSRRYLGIRVLLPLIQPLPQEFSRSPVERTEIMGMLGRWSRSKTSRALLLTSDIAGLLPYQFHHRVAHSSRRTDCVSSPELHAQDSMLTTVQRHGT